LFFKVKTPEEVLEILRGFDPVGTEIIHIGDALNRVLSEKITSAEDMPNFSRSSMDGYAVRAKDTFGASDSLPAFLELAGEVIMGTVPTDDVASGEAVRISTGGMIPEGADAVVMIEYCSGVDEKTIEVSRSVAPLENVISKGDDFRTGALIFEKGTVLRPQDIGLLAGLGIQKIEVYKRTKVGIISTGDEVIPIDRRLVLSLPGMRSSPSIEGLNPDRCATSTAIL
jgi:molybdopterin molybdotransferase